MVQIQRSCLVHDSLEMSIQVYKSIILWQQCTLVNVAVPGETDLVKISKTETVFYPY